MTVHDPDSSWPQDRQEWRVREAGIDPAKLRATLCALDASERPTLCLLIRNDLETLSRDLWRHLRRWDERAVRRVAHQLISLSATVGAERLRQSALRLQARLQAPHPTGLDPLAREIEADAARVRAALADYSATD